MATTNVLQWNPTASNQETDAEYLADSQRAGGATDPSLFDAALANKAFFQWSTYLAALFQAFAAKGFTTSDSNLSTLTATCANFLTTADVLPAVQNVTYAATVTLNAAQANGFYLQTMTGNLTIAAINGMTPGQIIALSYQQDGTGGRTVAFPSVLVGAAQPDPAANAVSAQLFEYDANTARLRAVAPLVSANGYWLPSVVTAQALTLSSGAPSGSTLFGDGASFTAKMLTYTDKTGINGYGTVYQNTSGASLSVAITGSLDLSVGHTATIAGLIGSTSFGLARCAVGSVTNSSGYTQIKFDVPPGWFYQVVTNAGFSPGDTDAAVLSIWSEWSYV